MDAEANQSRQSRKGRLTVLALFLFGGLFLAGLYLTAYFSESPEYRDSIPGVPNRVLRIVSWNLRWDAARVSTAIEAMRPFEPDFVLLQGVSRKDAQVIASALNMRSGNELQMYYSPTNDSDPTEPGNAILSRFGLYKGRSIPKPKYSEDAKRPRPQSFGIWAEPVVEGRRFLLASGQFTPGYEQDEFSSIRDGSRKRSMPLIAGVAPVTGAKLTVEPFQLNFYPRAGDPLIGDISGTELGGPAIVYVSFEWQVTAVRSSAEPLCIELGGTQPPTRPVAIPATSPAKSSP